jgi:lysophospholipase L1-like esterase
VFRKSSTLVLTAILAVMIFRGLCQDPPESPDLPFLRMDKNRIENETEAFRLLYEKLFDLQRRQLGKAVVLHLGDSHVEAGYLPGVVRAGLQREFGDGGRGWLIPRALVPGRRKGQYIRTALEKRKDVASVEFRVGLKDDDPSPGFSRLVFFHDKGAEYLDFQILDTDRRILGTVRSSLSQGSANTSIVDLPILVREVIVRTVKTSKTQHSVQLYGISLESGRPGVIYHSWGINGATTDTFNRTPFLKRLLEILQPDLVIISLGTNDATGGGYKDDVFSANLSTLVAAVRTLCPFAAVLVTTPSDSFLRRTRLTREAVNSSVAAVQAAILRLGASQNLATWDLYSVMGAAGSIKLWQKKALAGKDLIHFTKPGYQLQGQFLLEALRAGYENYARNKSR